MEHKKWGKSEAQVKHDRRMEWWAGDETTGRGRARKNAVGVRVDFWWG